MVEQEYLKYCLEEIEEKLSWKPSNEWKESDFIRLSETITEKSGISISAHTLKRLFGKIKYKKYYNPQQATKDALAKFLEYASWSEFITLKKNQQQISKTPIKDTVKAKKLFLALLILASGVFLSIILFTGLSENDKKKKEVFKFSITDSVGVVPYTVSVNYDVSKIVSDSVLVDFGFNHPIKGPQSVIVNKEKFMRNFTYQIPGQYNIKLKNKGKVIGSKKILAKSNSWESYFNSESAIGGYWIDNKIKKKPFKGKLYYETEYLDSLGFDLNQVYYVAHRLFKEFNVDGDNFELNTRFKSSKKLGGITCYDFILRVICENENNNIKLMEKGCSQFSGMRIGRTSLSGANEDLSSFKFNLGVWNDLRLVIKNNKAQVFVNNKKIFNGAYKGTNGKIAGLEVVFKGTGMLDYISLKDLKTKKVRFKSSFN